MRKQILTMSLFFVFLNIGLFPNQPKDSLINRVFVAQKHNPTKGDWVGNVTKVLENTE